MARSTKDAWLSGPGDLRVSEVEDVPVKGQSVKVRGLPAAYSNEAQEKALEWKTWPNGETTSRFSTTKLEVLQFVHGVIEPQFSENEAKTIAEKFGPAWRKVIAKIDELSGVDKEAIEDANRRFQGGDAESERPSENGTAAGSGGSDDDVRTRVGDGSPSRTAG